jgi:hypothetical protein
MTLIEAIDIVEPAVVIKDFTDRSDGPCSVAGSQVSEFLTDGVRSSADQCTLSLLRKGHPSPGACLFHVTHPGMTQYA